MSLLTFVIPTRKRHRELAACVRSIAEQIAATDSDTRIHILYNHDEPDTVRAVERMRSKWAFIDATGLPGDPSYPDKFRAMFRLQPACEWVWTFGDDDELMPGGLKFMLGRLGNADQELKFIHVTEKTRSTGSNHAFTGRMIDLCCEIGWIEFTGFISGNVTRTEALARCADTPNWDTYAKCAFVQSCAILETLRKEQAQLIDGFIVKLQDHSDEHKAQIEKDWAGQAILEAYLHMDEALQVMFDQGIIKSLLPEKFFRYHTYHLWDRHITYFLHEGLANGNTRYDDWAHHIKNITKFVSNRDMADRVCLDVDKARRLVMLHAALSENCNIVAADLTALFNVRNAPQYPWTYMPEDKDAKIIEFAHASRKTA